MSKYKKHLFYSSIVLILISIVVFIFYNVLTNKYAYLGNGWKETPEEALEYQSHSGMPSESNKLSVTMHLDTIYYTDSARIIYVSKDDTLVNALCLSNSEGKWHFSGYSEETQLENATSFVLNGNPNQFIINPYYHDEKAKTVYGWKLSSVPDIVVNDCKTHKKTYDFSIGNKEWSIDYWWYYDECLPESDNIDVNYE